MDSTPRPPDQLRPQFALEAPHQVRLALRHIILRGTDLEYKVYSTPYSSRIYQQLAELYDTVPLCTA